MEQWSEAAFVGGHPALDFLNTVDDHGKTRTINSIADWERFVGWSQASGHIPRDTLAALRLLDLLDVGLL